MFKKLETEKESVIESKISDRWEKMNILKRSLENKKENFVFYDGPATANGMPGIHHMMAKLLKDTICKKNNHKNNYQLNIKDPKTEF